MEAAGVPAAAVAGANAGVAPRFMGAMQSGVQRNTKRAATGRCGSILWRYARSGCYPGGSTIMPRGQKPDCAYYGGKQHHSGTGG